MTGGLLKHQREAFAEMEMCTAGSAVDSLFIVKGHGIGAVDSLLVE